MTTRQHDVVIIGAGIIGCCIAFEMGKRGYRTLNVDFQSTAGAGSTANSCGNVRFHYSTRDGVALAYESAWYWHNWRDYLETTDERGYAPFVNTGTVFIKSAMIDFARFKRNFDAVGLKYEELDVATMQAMMPYADFHSFHPPRRPDDPRFFDPPAGMLEGGCLTPESGYVSDPLLASQNVEAAAKAVGGTFLYGRRVTAVRQAGGRVQGVTLDDGRTIDAPIVVNVAGPHSFQITAMAGQSEHNNIKTKALRHEVHVAPFPAGHDPQKVGYHANDTDIGAYYRPETGGMILIGSVDPACDPKEFVDPDDFDREVSETQWKAQVYRLARRIPSLTIPSSPRGVVDLYDVSDDWIPIYDKSDLNGFYQAIGTSGNQFKTAPVAGGLMAELIARVEEGYPHDESPLQYTLPHLGLVIDSGAFHRNRDINPDSSFSVIG